MSFENRQLPPLPPVMDNSYRDHIVSSHTCDHLHIDCPSDLWEYKGRLGWPYDQPTEQLLAMQDQQRRQYIAEKALQFSGKDKGRRPKLQAHYAQHPLPAPPLSRFIYPSPASVPIGLSLPLAAAPYPSHSSGRGYPVQPEPEGLYGRETSNGYAYSPRGRPLERLPEPPQRQRSRSLLQMEALQTPYASGANIAPSLGPANAMTVTAGPQDSSSGGDSGYVARLAPSPYDQTYSSNPNQNNPFPPHSRGQPSNTETHGVPLYAPSPKKSTLPNVLRQETASEDLSGYLPKLRQALEKSAHVGGLEANPPNGTAEYELVQEYCYIDKESEDQVLGVFRDRHTANTEAAKIFLHRFWTQVMEDKQDYHVYMGEAGMMTLEIKTDGPQGEYKLASVFVRRKGDRGGLSPC